MQVQKIFLITPLGNKYSDARKHADRMWNEVFVPVSEKISTKDLKVEFERSDLMDEGSNSRVKKIMELIRESSGCIVDLYTIGNLNVMYEVGLAHSQGKRVFFLRSDKIEENEIPSDIRYYAEYYYTYNLDVFEEMHHLMKLVIFKKKLWTWLLQWFLLIQSIHYIDHAFTNQQIFM